MPNHSILLLVEDATDVRIVSWLLEAAGYPLERIKIQALGSLIEVERFLHGLPAPLANSCAFLAEIDAKSVPEAVEIARQQLHEPPVEIFCAVPELEAWLFADDNAALEGASSDWAREVIKALPLPEEIPAPKAMAKLIFGNSIDSCNFLRNVDADRASARSSSLRQFLTGTSKLLEMPREPILEKLSRSISRDIFAGLISEVVPSDTIIWRTANGDLFTAAELRQHIEEGTEIGRQYSSDVLRVARDFLKSQAKRGVSK